MEHSIVHDSMNICPIQMKITSKCRWMREEQLCGSVGEFWMWVKEKNWVKRSSKSLLWKFWQHQWAVNANSEVNWHQVSFTPSQFAVCENLIISGEQDTVSFCGGAELWCKFNTISKESNHFSESDNSVIKSHEPLKAGHSTINKIRCTECCSLLWKNWLVNNVAAGAVGKSRIWRSQITPCLSESDLLNPRCDCWNDCL